MAMSCAIACTEQSLETDSGNNEKKALSLSVIATTEESRSLITEDYLHNGAEIGICLTDSQGGDYDGVEYPNIKYTATGSSDKQSWSSDQDVMLSTSKATLYAYYPYSEEVDDIRNIAVRADSEVQTDYMYADAVTGLYNHNPEAELMLKHALCALRLSISRGTYTGKGIITGLSVTGDNMATEAVLDATSGTLHSIEGQGKVISLEITPRTVSQDELYFDILAIPTGRQCSINIEMIMDGEKFYIDTDAISLEQGKMSIIDIKVNNTSVSIAPVRVSAWRTNSSSSSAIGKSCSISIAGDTDGINLSNSIGTDGTVTIIAEPIYEGAEINPISFEGDATVTESLDESTGCRSIVLSDIQSDVSISFNSYCLWTTAVYNINSTSSDTHLVYLSSSLSNTLCTRMKIDGVEITPSNVYRFDSTGEHIVHLAFKKKNVIPTYAFYSNSNVISVTIPEGVTKMETYSIAHCNSLETVSLPQTLTYGSYDGMPYNKKLKSIVLPDNFEMGYGFLKECTALEHVSLPKNMKTIPSSLLSGCTNLKQIDIPESVTAISYGAFSYTGLTSLELPENVSSIPEQLCCSCKSLERVYFHSNITSIGARAFQNCNNLKQFNDADQYSLIIPEGISSVGDFAFDACDLFTSLSIPASLTSIGNGAFAMNGITDVSVDSANSRYEKRGEFNGIVEKASDILIYGCKVATVVPKSIKEIGTYAYYSTSIKSIDLHEDIRAIGSYAFYMTNTLASVISRALTPPVLGNKGVFDNPATGGMLKVPSEALSAYKSEWMISTDISKLGFSTYRWGIKALADGE